MPIYEYRCPNCQQVFEEWCKHVEDSEVTHSCPVCSTVSKRMISNTSFALKGEGWYLTEYGSHKGKSDSSSASDNPSSGSAASDSSATTLPPPAPPTKAELASTTPIVSTTNV